MYRAISPQIKIKKAYIHTNVPHYVENSQLICISNQSTGFYMMGKISR